MAEPNDPLLSKAPGPAGHHPAEQAVANRVEPLLADQEARWRWGERVLVEAYLQEQPTLGSHPEAVLDLLYHEIVLREGLGETPTLREYVRRFPHLAQVLAAQFDFDRAIQGERTKGQEPGIRSQGSYGLETTDSVPADGFVEQAFAAEPKLAEDLRTANRYNAACAACLSAAGQGKDSAKLDDKQRAHWREQAVAWLSADLALWSKQLESGEAQDRAIVQQKLRHGQEDTDLAGIREAAALPKLPAAEQAACRKLWADVAALLKRVAGKP